MCVGNVQILHNFIYDTWITSDLGIHRVLEPIPHRLLQDDYINKQKLFLGIHIQLCNKHKAFMSLDNKYGCKQSLQSPAGVGSVNMALDRPLLTSAL